MPREPNAKYIELMNGRYDRLRAACWDGSTLTLTYDGHWTARIDVRALGRDRWATGDGVTREIALAALEEAMGLEKWAG